MWSPSECRTLWEGLGRMPMKLVLGVGEGSSMGEGGEGESA